MSKSDYQRVRTFRRRAVAIAAGVCLGALGLTALHAQSGAATPPSKQAILAVLDQPPTPAIRRPGDNIVSDAVSKLEPAIVTVHIEGHPVQEQQQSPFGNDPFFRQFFGGAGGQGGQMVVPKGAGSGIIISPDGYILTNNHVVQDAAKVTVNVGDKAYVAKVVGADPVSDIAVVKIDTGGVQLPVAQLGDFSGIRVGDWAIAIGNPLDVGTTVTLGIISAINRSGFAAEGHSLNKVIQTDAAINPGNSGGALANIDGQVIGINEAILSPTGSYVGIGFAIPIDEARTIAYQLIKNGRIVRSYLGVAYMPLSGIPASSRKDVGIDVQGDEEVVVSQVFPGSPAATAGLQTYDVILQANRQKMTDPDSLSTLTGTLKPGDTLTLLVSRNGHDIIVPVTLKERPQDFGENTQQSQGDQLPQLPGNGFGTP